MPFPLHDPVGPSADPLPATALQVLTGIASRAAETDANGVPRSTINELAAAGLLGVPLTPASAAKELAEVLAGCDATTWFCWVQHVSPMQVMAAAVDSPQTPAGAALRDRFLPGLQAGSLLAGVAFAHVRRPGPANPTATRVTGGWRIDGTLDWVTSWDIADVIVVTARAVGADDGTLVAFVIPGGHSESPCPTGVNVGEPLALLAMTGTHTRPVTFENTVIDDHDVLAVVEFEAWLAEDRLRTADTNPATFGLIRASVAELDERATLCKDELMARQVRAIIAECRQLRARAYELIGEPDREATRPERLAVRAASLDLAVRAATANVVAAAGAAMLSGTSTERRLRESMFLLVQAQTQDTRAASITFAMRGVSG
ncbi:MAG: acyl-CoA dehydrogenase family protein [Actinomycetes bacterium]